METRGTVCHVLGVARVEGALGEWGGRGSGETRAGGDNARPGWRIRSANVFNACYVPSNKYDLAPALINARYKQQTSR